MIAEAKGHDPTRTLVVAWSVGLVLRWLAGIFAIGFFARDDYFHVLDIALSWIDDPSFVWHESDKAGAGIRSELFPRIVELILRGLRALGIDDPVNQLRGLQVILGTYSSLMIPALWRLTEGMSTRTRGIAAALAAGHFALPYLGTRLLIEAVALPPLLWGLAQLRLYWRDTAATPDGISASRLLLGAFAIGIACWLRYPVAVIGMTAACLIAFRSPRVAGAVGQRRREVQLMALGAGAAVALQGFFDLVTVGEFLGPLRANIATNLVAHDELTRSHPFSYLGLWLVLTLPPLSLVVIPAMIFAARREALIGMAWLAFVLFHSLIPHKEERFMIPALPLFLVLMAMVPDELQRARGSWADWARRWQTIGVVLFVVVHLAALTIALTASTQSNVRDAMLAVGRDRRTTALVSAGPEIQSLFLQNPKPPVVRIGRPDLVELGRVLAQTQRNAGVVPNRYICFDAECAPLELMLAALAFDCEDPEVFEGFWADRLAYRINPEHNRRRSPVRLYRCRRPALALGKPSAPD